MNFIDETTRDLLRLPSSEKEKLKRLDKAIVGKTKRWWLSWWGLVLLGAGIGMKWINPIFAVPVYITFIWLGLALKGLQGASEAMLNEYESLQQETEEPKADREKRRDAENIDRVATRLEEIQSQAESQPRQGTIGFGGYK